MNFLKSVSKSVGDGVNLITLDGIVDDILKNHSKEIKSLLETRQTIFTEAEEILIEEAWSVKFNESYDRRASKALDRPIPENWKEDKDIIAVRKRILNRGLEKHKGQLRAKYEENNKAMMTLVNEVVETATKTLNEFVEKTTATFPVLKTNLETLLTENKESINYEVLLSAPDIAALSLRFKVSNEEKSSWDQFQEKLLSTHDSLRHQNKRAIESSITALKKKNSAQLAPLIIEMLSLNETTFQTALKNTDFLSAEDVLLYQEQHVKTITAAQKEILAILEAHN